jgi:hypothetical protein
LSFPATEIEKRSSEGERVNELYSPNPNFSNNDNWGEDPRGEDTPRRRLGADPKHFNGEGQD